jgi:hypothetical protein
VAGALLLLLQLWQAHDTLDDMAEAARALGYRYAVISDY